MHRLTKRLNKMVKAAIVLPILLATIKLNGQDKNLLSLQDAYRLAEQNYPAIRQKGLIKQTEDLALRNLATGYLPQLNITGQATYQSDVTRVDIPIPNIKVPSQSKDQYRLAADVSQLIYDGGLIKEQKNLQQLNSAVEEGRVEVELYALRMRVNQIYLSILYQDQLLKQNELFLNDIQAGINKVQQQVNNGTVLRSNLQVLQVQLLQTQQRAAEIRNTKRGMTDALALFINMPINETDQLQMPMSQYVIDTVIQRPEVRLYENQARLFEGQQKLIDARNQPKASAFVQGGYGRPGLNLLSNKLDPFYVTGVRLNWSLGGFYNAKRERSLLEISRQTIGIQKETFLLNTQSQLKQQQAEIARFAELVASDQSIIELRSKIKEAAKAQLENAVITANDYLREIIAEDAARQALATHQLQLLQAQINYQLTSGKL
ncbi:TolC family protein [Segetibacter aerophilus]|uniref:Transporter n=1 Tax=Segetibacter aerophilus TaxID=670293 RepID=A0A512BJR3_9BACT|nr:TolC family protein [Segetibacter aerophilus]GEO12210.1 transporter [Segetibacter aerophilus]